MNILAVCLNVPIAVRSNEYTALIKLKQFLSKFSRTYLEFLSRKGSSRTRVYRKTRGRGAKERWPRCGTGSLFSGGRKERRRPRPYPGSCTITYAKDSSCASHGGGARRFFFTEFTIRPAMHYREYDIHLASDPWDLMAAAAPSRSWRSKRTAGPLRRLKYPRSRRPFRLRRSCRRATACTAADHSRG